MTNEATRITEYTDTKKSLYLSFELGESEWKLGFNIGFGEKTRRRTIPARDIKKLQEEIEGAKQRFGLAKDAPVMSCYEAGREGFWLHRYLSETGVENLVVDSSSIEVNRRARRKKTDRLDVQKLLTMLIRYAYGERKVWSVVQVPSVEDEDRRQLHRELKTLKEEKVRTMNRIKGLLANQGIRLKGTLDLSEGKLDGIRLWNGLPLPAGLKARLAREWLHVQFLGAQILILECERRQLLRKDESKSAEQARELSTLCGIGRNGSWILAHEFFGWRDFQNRRQVGALAGLCPTPYHSGDSLHEQGIGKDGNRHVRGLSVQLAWAWIRFQSKSKLTLWFQRRFSHSKGARKVGIVAVARKLLIDLWRFLERGVVPEGAQLKGEAK
jgi:transposase